MHRCRHPRTLRHKIAELPRRDDRVAGPLQLARYGHRDRLEEAGEPGAGQRVCRRHDYIGRARGGAPGHHLGAVVGAGGQGGGDGEGAALEHAEGVRCGGFQRVGVRTYVPATVVGELAQYWVRGFRDAGAGRAEMRVREARRVNTMERPRPGMLMVRIENERMTREEATSAWMNN